MQTSCPDVPRTEGSPRGVRLAVSKQGGEGEKHDELLTLQGLILGLPLGPLTFFQVS